MNDADRMIELMQLDVDGRATPDQQETLRAALARDPKLRAEHARLVEVVEALHRLPGVEPPATLRAEILAGLHSEALRPVTGRRRPLWAWMPYGYAAAAGLLLGVVGTLWLVGHPALDVESSQPGAGATMAPVTAPAAQKDAEFEPISGPGLVGRRSITADGGATRVVIEFEAAGPVDVDLRVNRAGQTVYSETFPEP